MMKYVKNFLITIMLLSPLFIAKIFAAYPSVTLETTMGNIVIELDTKTTPITTKNFIDYVQSGYYENTLFHRVIDDFMIQGGGFNSDMTSKPTKFAPILNEANKAAPNKTGTIAMARTNAPHSATSQFFINVNDNDFLNHQSKTPSGWGYCVFGKVTSGMDIINQIKSVNTTSKNGYQNVPIDNIVILKATVSNA